MQWYTIYNLMVLHQESGLGKLKAVFFLAMNWKELETWLGFPLESRSIIHLWVTFCVSIPLACLLPSLRASHLLCSQYISQSLLFKYAESCLRKRFFSRLISLTVWNEWCLALLFKTEWFNNGIRPGTSKPRVLRCHSCLPEQPLWFFPACHDKPE